MVGNTPAEFRPFVEALLSRSDDPEALLRLLGSLGERVPKAAALSFALQLRESLPTSAYLRRVTDVFIREHFPVWYIQAINDSHRNASYRTALQALVKPTSIVIEAGTGSGLFAMLAAQAGAQHVYTVEVDATVVEIARENIARNGLRERITVIHDRIENVGTLGSVPRADILMHEFVSDEFLNAGMFDWVQKCRQQLLAPDGLVLPQAMGACGMLVEGAWLLADVRVPALVEGFDVSAINRLALHVASIRGPIPNEVQISDRQLLAEVDLCGERGAVEASSVTTFTVSRDGTVDGVLQWVSHRFPDGTVYQNRPELRCFWRPKFWPFATSRQVLAGEKVRISVRHTATELFIDEA